MLFELTAAEQSVLEALVDIFSPGSRDVRGRAKNKMQRVRLLAAPEDDIGASVWSRA